MQADGPYPWAADYPSPGGFINLLLTCASYRPRTSENANWGQYCNHRVDAMIARARALQTTDPQQAALLLSEVDRAIVDDAPVIPIMNLQDVKLVSQRVRNYTSSPLGYGALLDQLWVR